MQKAEAGEEIAVATAREIVAEAKKKRPRRQKAVPTDKLGVRLVKALERDKERWNPDELPDLARPLREFAHALEERQWGVRKKSNG